MEGSEIDREGLVLPPNVKIKLGKKNKDVGQSRRHLSIVTGVKPILAARYA
jgi:hypothetical protein